MTVPRFVAVIDVGKTNAKLALHDLDRQADVFVATAPNRVRGDGPYPHFDVEGLWDFLLGALTDAARVHAVDAVTVTTHGASAVLLDEAGGLALPFLDYEHDGPETARSAYDAERPPFSETFSPRMPNGLNLGAQLFWQERAFPDAFARTRAILFPPQYWAWRLTGQIASEVTSLGCHTDLWAPRAGAFSSLVERRGWARLFPPRRSAFAALGPVRPEIAARLRLGERPVPVHCGIHDSNASLLPYLLGNPPPFTVLSTGTWVVGASVGADGANLDAARGLTVNTDAFGRTAPSARFMGGREFDILTAGRPAEPTAADIDHVLRNDVFALPTFVGGTGPFPAGTGRWTQNPDALSPGTRTAAASLYAAAITAAILELSGADGPTIVEGPFARNTLYLDALRAITGRTVRAAGGATGTTAGAALLALEPDAPRRTAVAEAEAAAPPDPRLRDYGRRWAAAVAAGGD